MAHSSVAASSGESPLDIIENASYEVRQVASALRALAALASGEGLQPRSDNTFESLKIDDFIALHEVLAEALDDRAAPIETQAMRLRHSKQEAQS